MAILNMKKKNPTLADLDCKAINKMQLFNEKKNNANSAVSEFQDELTDLHNQIHTKEAEYKDTLDSQLLREIRDLKNQKSQVEELMHIQRQAFGNGKTVLELTEEDHKELSKAVAPYRKTELELTDKLTKQLADVEKTIEQLGDARAEYWELYMQIYQTAVSASGDQFAVFHLKDNKPMLEASYKLQELASHKTFPRSFYH